MKAFNILGVSVILASAFIGMSVKGEAEENLLVSPSKITQPLEGAFPVIGDRLNKEMIRLAETLSRGKLANNEISVWDCTRFLQCPDEDKLPWARGASPVTYLNDDMKILDPEYLAANRTTFTNDLSTTQTWKTPEYSHTVENSVSTTNTTSTGVEASVDTSFDVPFVSGDISVSATFDYSDEETVTDTTTQTWTVPSQDIVIEPHQTVRVEWVATIGKAVGTASLDVRLRGVVPYQKDEDYTSYGENIDNAFASYDKFAGQGILSTMPSHLTSDERSLYKVRAAESVDRTFGTAKYEVKQGLDMNMRVYEVRNANGKASSQDRLIETRTFSADGTRIK